MKDDRLISLNAALDAIDANNGILYDSPTLVASLKKMVNALPSAQSEQPEIVRCKDCKHWEYDVIFADGWCRGKQQGNPEWFCADAERKNNV